MSERTRCSRTTQRGTPCRNPAVPGSDPPVCRRHINRSSAAKTAGGTPASPPDHEPFGPARPGFDPTHLYLPHLTAGEIEALTDGRAGDLRPELTLVRAVLRRLLAAFDSPASETPDELRRLAALVFSGARTVAHLLAQSGDDANTDAWLDSALDALSGDYALDL